MTISLRARRSCRGLHVNGFVNETRRNGRDGMGRGVMAETGDSP
jgi:hypothetical protein